MGSFRSQKSINEGQAVLTAADRPMAEYKEVEGERVLVQAEVPASEWLQEGESITYWTEFPHGIAADIADAATVSEVDRKGRIKATYKVGRAAVATFLLGIVKWTLLDENGNEVPWQPANLDDPTWYVKGKNIMSGLPTPVVKRLQELMDSGSPERLDAPAPDPRSEADTVGND